MYRSARPTYDLISVFVLFFAFFFVPLYYLVKHRSDVRNSFNPAKRKKTKATFLLACFALLPFYGLFLAYVALLNFAKEPRAENILFLANHFMVFFLVVLVGFTRYSYVQNLPGVNLLALQRVSLAVAILLPVASVPILLDSVPSDVSEMLKGLGCILVEFLSLGYVLFLIHGFTSINGSWSKSWAIIFKNRTNFIWIIGRYMFIIITQLVLLILHDYQLYDNHLIILVAVASEVMFEHQMIYTGFLTNLCDDCSNTKILKAEHYVGTIHENSGILKSINFLANEDGHSPGVLVSSDHV